MTELLIKNILSDILFGNRICESVEDQQIVDYFYKELLLEKILYGEPITVPELRKLLHNKIVNFEFIKLDGEVRPAKGTTMIKYIPQSQHPKGIRPSSPKVAAFYDLEKLDWRSVSQRSKEIVLKQDQETGKPIIMVKDKEVGDNVAVKPTQPKATIDNKPPEEVIPQESKPEVTKVKPIEKGENEKRYYLINPETGASIIIDISAKDLIKKLKELGKGWEVVTKDKFEEREEEVTAADEKTPEIKKEPEETIVKPKNIISGEEDLDNIEADMIK